MNKKLLGNIFGTNIFMESDIEDNLQREIIEKEVGKWLEEADFVLKEKKFNANSSQETS